MIALNHPVALTGDRIDKLLRYYQAEEGDGWSGFIVAPRGWSGRMPLPSPPARTMQNAAIVWQRHQVHLLEEKPAPQPAD